MRGRQDIDSPYAGMNRIKFAGSVEFTVSALFRTPRSLSSIGLRTAVGYTARAGRRALPSEAAEGAGALPERSGKRTGSTPGRLGVPHWREAGRKPRPPKGQAELRPHRARQSLR
jgi:hypothetical protein